MIEYVHMTAPPPHRSPRYLRRGLDAAILLVAASNLHHLLSGAVRLHNSRRGFRGVTFDAETISALFAERGNTHGL